MRRHQSLTMRVYLTVCTALLLGPAVACVQPAPAYAIDSARTAVMLVQQAAKAYETGDFVKAADLYQKAWRLDASPAYLWALARSEHLAGQNESAIEHYRAFIANPGGESTRVAKAQGYLAEVEQEVNKGRTRDAEAAIRAGNPALAAELYLQAYKATPGRLELLFKAAVAEQMAESYQSALQHLDAFLTLAPANADERGQAQAREQWLRQKLGLKPLKVVERTVTEPAAPAPTVSAGPTPPVADTKIVPKPAEPAPQAALAGPAATVAKPQAGAAWPAWPGWTAVAGGGVAVVAGVVLLVGAQADAAQLAKDQEHADGSLITGLSHELAASRASAINTRAAAGWVATGVGLGASAFGVWWLTRHPETSAVVLPTGTGAALTMRF